MSNRSRHALIYSPVSSNLLRQLLAINIFFSNSNSIWFCFCSKCKKKVFKRKYYKWKQTKHIAVDNQNGRQAGRQKKREKAKNRIEKAKGRQIKKYVHFILINSKRSGHTFVCVSEMSECVCLCTISIKYYYVSKSNPSQHDYTNRRKSCHTSVSMRWWSYDFAYMQNKWLNKNGAELAVWNLCRSYCTTYIGNEAQLTQFAYTINW